MVNKKFVVDVSGSVIVWAKDENEASDMAISLCEYASEHLNSDSLMNDEGYAATELSVVENGVHNTGETDED